MLFTFSTFGLVVGLPLAFYVLYSLFLKPWWKVEFYRQQGCKMTCFPVLGNFKACLDALSSQGDFYGHTKQELKKNPKLKAIGGNLLGAAQIYLTDPNAVTEFYKQQEKYVKSPSGLDIFKLFLGEGLVTTEGEQWKRHRKIISASFHYDFLKKILPDVAQIANQFLEGFKKKDLEDVSTMTAFESITGEVVGRLFFGTKFSEYQIQGKPVTAFMSNVGSRTGSELFSLFYLLLGAERIKSGILPRHKKLMDDIKELNSFARTIIESRMKVINAAKQNGEVDKLNNSTLLDALLSTSDLTVQEIIDEFVTFFIAGTDTTGHLIAMAVYYLSQNPQYKERLVEEAEKYIQDPSMITTDALNEMEFTTAFLKEALRFASPAGVLVDRIALQDHNLGDLRVKKGTLVNVSIIGNNFNPDFHDDVDKFDPNRWITDSKTKRKYAENPRIFLPFSAGGHNCIGQHLAMNEARIIFGLFLKKFDFVLSPNYEHKMTLRLTHEPLNRLSFKLIPK